MWNRTAHLVLVCVSAIAAGCGPQAETPVPAPSPGIPVAVGDTGANALDWAGTYRGVVPCADCEGIETSVTLEEDLTYTRTTRYLGKGAEVFEQSGTFTWDEAGTTIRLSNAENSADQYLVGENQLIQLDLAGNRITGDLADRYVLAKDSAVETAAAPAGITGVQWALVEIAGEAIGDTFEGRESPSLMLDAETLSASGFAGCNRYSGGYEMTDADELRFSRMVATRMACPELEVESKFLGALEAVRGYTLVDAKLELKDEGSAVVLRFEAAK